MENRNRNVLVVVIIVIVALCCLVAALAAGGIAWFTSRTAGGWSEGWGMDRVSERTDLSFEVGAAPALSLENMAGDIDIRTGEEGRIQVVATRHAPSRAGLEQVLIQPSQEGDAVRIVTRRSTSRLTSNMSVDMEIVLPPGTSLEISNGAGQVTVVGVTGDIEVHTGAGDVDVRDAQATVRLDTGAGDVTYEGEPVGACTFSTGAGSVNLLLPAGLRASVDLDTGIGSVDLGGFDVDGSVTSGQARGTIGGGGDVTIEAHTGAGDIDLVQR